MGGVVLGGAGGRRKGDERETEADAMVGERQRSRRPRAAATRRAHGGCGRSRRWTSFGEEPTSTSVGPPRPRLASPVRATPPIYEMRSYGRVGPPGKFRIDMKLLVDILVGAKAITPAMRDKA